VQDLGLDKITSIVKFLDIFNGRVGNLTLVAQTTDTRNGVVDVNEDTKVLNLSHLTSDELTNLEISKRVGRNIVLVNVRLLQTHLDVVKVGIDLQNLTLDELVNLDC
jgi:hypothetical protein